MSSVDVARLGKNVVKAVSTNGFCRVGARHLSSLKPQLDAAGVRLIAIGLEELGVEDFVAGGYFDGELYIDAQQNCYKELQYKRHSLFAVMCQVFRREGRAALAESKRMGVKGDLKGNGLLYGGAIIVSAGGKKCLYHYTQTNVAEHVPNERILETLGLNASAATGGSSAQSDSHLAPPFSDATTPPTCDGDVCSLPQPSHKLK